MENEDDKSFYAIDFEDSFAYPNVYPDDCESSEIWYYANGSLADDDFICKLDRLHNLERCTVHEEEAKLDRRKTSVSSAFDNLKKSATKRLTWPRSKQSSTKTNDIALSIRQNVTKRVIPSPIPTRTSSIRAFSAGMIRRDKKQSVSNDKLSNLQENEIIKVQKRLRPVEYKENSASFKKFADTYIKNTFKSVHPPTIPKPPTIFNRVKDPKTLHVKIANATSKRDWIRPNSVTPQPRTSFLSNCVGKPPLLKPTKYKQKYIEKNDVINKVSEKVKLEKIELEKRLKENKIESSKLGLKLEEEEYGENKDERALFAVALPDVMKHYSKHTRGVTSQVKAQSAAA